MREPVTAESAAKEINNRRHRWGKPSEEHEIAAWLRIPRRELLRRAAEDGFIVERPVTAEDVASVWAGVSPADGLVAVVLGLVGACENEKNRTDVVSTIRVFWAIRCDEILRNYTDFPWTTDGEIDFDFVPKHLQRPCVFVEDNPRLFEVLSNFDPGSPAHQSGAYREVMRVAAEISKATSPDALTAAFDAVIAALFLREAEKMVGGPPASFLLANVFGQSLPVDLLRLALAERGHHLTARQFVGYDDLYGIQQEPGKFLWPLEVYGNSRLMDEYRPYVAKDFPVPAFCIIGAPRGRVFQQHEFDESQAYVTRFNRDRSIDESMLVPQALAEEGMNHTVAVHISLDDSGGFSGSAYVYEAVKSGRVVAMILDEASEKGILLLNQRKGDRKSPVAYRVVKVKDLRYVATEDVVRHVESTGHLVDPAIMSTGFTYKEIHVGIGVSNKERKIGLGYHVTWGEHLDLLKDPRPAYAAAKTAASESYYEDEVREDVRGVSDDGFTLEFGLDFWTMSSPRSLYSHAFKDTFDPSKHAEEVLKAGEALRALLQAGNSVALAAPIRSLSQYRFALEFGGNP